jgi:nucleoside-diphosphate-sugar epimerase
MTHENQRTILLTGATGVVGQAVLDRLAGTARVICAVHRARIDRPGVDVARVDLRQPLLGLSELAYRDLAARIDGIVHSAAVTDFRRRDDSLEQTNVEGTQRMLDLAAAADAPLFHLSTAFLHTRGRGDRDREALRYARSKGVAEALVQDSGLPALVLRPSIVVGHSSTGKISRFQGIYDAAGAIMSGLAPVLPFSPDWFVDFVPHDLVAAAVVAAVEREFVGQTLWLTAGESALTIGEAVDVILEIARRRGRAVEPPRFVEPEVYDRLIKPVFLPAMPARIRRTARLLETFAPYVAVERRFPSSLYDLRWKLHVAEPPDPRATLRRSIEHWASEQRFAAPAAAEAVA